MSKIKLDKDKEFWQHNKLIMDDWIIYKNDGLNKPKMNYEDNMPYSLGTERIYVTGS